MRCFIAIDIGDEIRAALGDLQQRLQNGVDIKRSDVKWVRPGNIHLTLKFLGEADKEIIPDLGQLKPLRAGIRVSSLI